MKEEPTKYCLKIQLKSGAAHAFSIPNKEVGASLIAEWAQLVIAEPKVPAGSTMEVTGFFPNRILISEIAAIWVSVAESLSSDQSQYLEMVRLQTKFLKQNVAEESWNTED